MRRDALAVIAILAALLPGCSGRTNWIASQSSVTRRLADVRPGVESVMGRPLPPDLVVRLGSYAEVHDALQRQLTANYTRLLGDDAAGRELAAETAATVAPEIQGYYDEETRTILLRPSFYGTQEEWRAWMSALIVHELMHA